MMKSIKVVAGNVETNGNWPGRDPMTKEGSMERELLDRLISKDRY